MDIRKTETGVTIDLGPDETMELLTSLALSMAAYSILQNFMTDAQKHMTLPSIMFISRLGAGIWDILDDLSPDPSPKEEGS